jgi:hypothetical protein
MRWKKREHNEIIVPLPKVKVLKVCNPNAPKRLGFADMIIKQFFPKAKGVRMKTVAGLDGQVIGVIDRWGTPTMVPKTSVFKCPFNFIAKLENRGYEVLGRGAYSTVLGKKGHDRVIKVSRSLDDWIDYVQWGAKNGYAGNFVPRVYSWKRHCRPATAEFCGERNNDWSVAVVERMKTTCHDEKHDMSLLLNLYYPANSGSTMAALYMEDLCPGSYKFFHELVKNNFSSDIGRGNVMVRADGSFCVTDPTCGSIKTEKKRFRSGDLSPSALWILNNEFIHMGR